MKIDSGPKQVTLPPTADNRPAQLQAKPGEKSGQTEQTEITLSARAAQLKELETRLAAIPVVDRARVESIKQAIASGQYTINTENISEHLLDSVKEMLNVAK
jgi:negative regulator of flagellin synthesis FlgM